MLLGDLVETDPPSVSERPDVYPLLGRAYAALGETPRAIALLMQCLTELREDEPADPIAFVRLATELAAALVDAGDASGARRVLVEALPRADRVTDRNTLVRLYWSLAQAHAAAGLSVWALGYVPRAIALLEATEDTLHLARAHHLAASILLD